MSKIAAALNSRSQTRTFHPLNLLKWALAALISYCESFGQKVEDDTLTIREYLTVLLFGAFVAAIVHIIWNLPL